ncbi:MAG: 16S rRNA (cytidine(1402)-2'-O)-methyltransferase [Campylobacterota bacterium]|nr:16S rRNA (cytidine(1402)-2'-O)-methyltransferase [Campylobacterota bacterium]
MLVFVPTPIGNLGDVSFRTIEVLKDTEQILCEDTRVTKKLIQLISDKFDINFPSYTYISVHSHNEKQFLEQKQNQELLKHKKCVYLSDAGMPCVSDPGSFLVEFCIQNDMEYDVLPGANAILTAYASSGFDDVAFTFFGFLPHKGNDRKNKLDEVLNNKYLSIVYESPHRLMKLLEELNTLVPNKVIFITKELTKKYQTRYKGKASDIYNEFKTITIKGEWVVIIKNEDNKEKGIITLDDISNLQLPPKQKAKLISKLTGENIKDVYNNLIG